MVYKRLYQGLYPSAIKRRVKRRVGDQMRLVELDHALSTTRSRPARGQLSMRTRHEERTRAHDETDTEGCGRLGARMPPARSTGRRGNPTR
jgi:hypothetical protein